MKYDVTAIGELLIDFTPITIDGKTGFLPNPGGAPANVAAAVGKLGGNSAFIGKVGDDAFGHFLKEILRGECVDTAGLILDKSTPTTLAFVHLDETGERSFSFYRKYCADTQLSRDELNLFVIARSKFLHFGSVSLTDAPAREAVLCAVQHASKHKALISYDPNYRPALWNSEAEAVSAMRAVLALADLIKVSQEELRLLTGTSDLSAGSASLAEHGARLVVVTLGADGALFRYGDHAAHVPSIPIKAVDTNGAGDAFWGALLYQLTRTENPFALSHTELEQAVRFANVAGALAATKSGAIPALPSPEEVYAHMH